MFKEIEATAPPLTYEIQLVSAVWKYYWEVYPYVPKNKKILNK